MRPAARGRAAGRAVGAHAGRVPASCGDGLGAGTAGDERDGQDDLPLEATLGPVDPLEEPGRRDVAHPGGVLVHDGERRPQRPRQREVAEADQPHVAPADGLERRHDTERAARVGREDRCGWGGGGEQPDGEFAARRAGLGFEGDQARLEGDPCLAQCVAVALESSPRGRDLQRVPDEGHAPVPVRQQVGRRRRAPPTSSSITLSAVIPRGGRSTKTIAIRASHGSRYDWSREIGVVISPASWRPSNASTPARSRAPSSPRLVTMTAFPRAWATASTAWVSAAKNGSEMSGTATPIALSLPLRKVLASTLGTYCSSATARSTRSRTSSDT